MKKLLIFALIGYALFYSLADLKNYIGGPGSQDIADTRVAPRPGSDALDANRDADGSPASTFSNAADVVPPEVPPPTPSVISRSQVKLLRWFRKTADREKERGVQRCHRTANAGLAVIRTATSQYALDGRLVFDSDRYKAAAKVEVNRTRAVCLDRINNATDLELVKDSTHKRDWLKPLLMIFDRFPDYNYIGSGF